MARSNEKLEQLPDYGQIKKAPGRAKTIQLLQEGHQLKQVITEAEERLKEIKAELAQIQLMNDLPGLRYREFCFIATEKEGKSSLSKELLIDQGVDPAVIFAAMKKGNSYIQTELCMIGEKHAD